MATTLIYSVADFQPFTKIISADMNTKLNDIKSRLNWAGGTDATTGLGDDNIQSIAAAGGGLTRATKLKAGTASHVVINDGTGAMSSEAQLAISRGGLGTDFSASLASNVGSALIVNNAGTALSLGSPLQSTLTESLSGVVSSLTAGESISTNNAVCLDVAMDASSNSIFRVFNADYTKANRRTSFLGFAQAAATVTAGIYTWVASANFVTSNSIAFSINGRAYTVAFTTDNATTLQAVATAMATDPDVNGAVSDGSHTVTVTGKGGLFINITGSAVTGGASQPTITVTNTQAPSGQNAKIQCFGPLAGFTSLTPCALYYLNTAGGITATPADTNPILVGQALSSTVLFVTTNANTFKFSTPSTLIRSHGSSTTVSSGAVQDVEHFNFTAWSAGTSSSNGTRFAAQSGNPAGYAGLHWQIDGYNSSGTPTALTQGYNKASWATGSNRATALRGWTGNSFNSFLYSAKGSTSGSTAGDVSTVTKWNAVAWASTTGMATASDCSGGFVQGGLLHVASGSNAVTAHETMNSSDVLGSATAAPTGGSTGGSNNYSGGGFYSDLSGNVYNWSGSWSSAVVTPYVFCAATDHFAASAYNTSSQLAYTNGGNTVSTTVVNTTAVYNGASWSSGTSSTNSRCGSAASVI